MGGEAQPARGGRLTGQVSYGLLVDPRQESAQVLRRLDIAPGTPSDVAAAALDMVFRRDPDCAAVVVMVGGRQIGVAGRDRIAALVEAAGTAREDVSLSSGDRAFLPGYPTRYEVFVFGCEECDRHVYRILADERPPACEAGHGPLRLVE